jgi:hypothetical protein
MTSNKKEAIEFCIDKYVTNRMVDIWIAIILTFGLVILIFPILFWLIYRYYRAKMNMNVLKNELNNNPEKFKKVYATFGHGYNREGDKIKNSVEIYINDKLYDIPQLYIWFSKYKTKERFAEVLNENNI